MLSFDKKKLYWSLNGIVTQISELQTQNFITDRILDIHMKIVKHRIQYTVQLQYAVWNIIKSPYMEVSTIWTRLNVPCT